MTMHTSQVDRRALDLRLPSAPSAQIGRLQGILRVGVALQDAAGGAKQQAVVASHDVLEGRAVAVGGARRQIRVGRGVRQGVFG